jgi:hypothetical protein
MHEDLQRPLGRPSRKKKYPWDVLVSSSIVAVHGLCVLRLLLSDVITPAPQSLDDLG